MRNSMKFFAVILLFACFQEVSSAQQLNDQSLVIQKCIDLSELQQYYPLDNAGLPEQIYVMEYPVKFPADLSVSKSGKQIVFMSREDIIKNQIKAYFIFRSLDITGNLAKANINYFYDFDYSTKHSKMIMLNLELNKTDSTWEVTQINLKEITNE